MMEIIDSGNPLKGEFEVPGDKSISHRAAILSSIVGGTINIRGYSTGEDCLSTLKCLQKLGVDIYWDDKEKGKLTLVGKSLYLNEPDDVLDAGNSGTTTRLLLGILSGQNFFSCITGDNSLRQRPMKRVVDPLSEMGALFYGRDNSNKLPLCCSGKVKETARTSFKLPVASAQVKSAILLAGLYEKKDIDIIEPSPTRDHTERMLKAMGVKIESKPMDQYNEMKSAIKISLKQPSKLEPDSDIEIPGDFSSAAFLIGAAILIKGSKICVKNVGINPSRTGFLQILEKMGANIILKNERYCYNEPVADIEVEYTSDLKSCTVEGDLVSNVIDELPLLAVLATRGSGVTILKDASELRYKETDRIKAITSELGKMGASIIEREDGFTIEGPTSLNGADVESFNDHRIAMSLAVAAKIAEGETRIKDFSCADISFPGFYEYLR